MVFGADAHLKDYDYKERNKLKKMIFTQYPIRGRWAWGRMRPRRVLAMFAYKGPYGGKHKISFSCLHNTSILSGAYQKWDIGQDVMEDSQSHGEYHCGCGLVVKSDLVPMPSTTGTPHFILDIEVKGESIGYLIALRGPRG